MADDDTGGTGNSASPWAGDVPVSPAPVEFTWVSHEPAQEPGAAAAAAALVEHGDGSIDAPPSGTGPEGSRRNVVIVVAALAVIACVVGALTVLGGDDGESDATRQADTTVPVTDPATDELPPVETDAPATTAIEDAPTTTVESVETGTGEANRGATPQLIAGEWSNSAIDVPSELQGIEPTTIALVSTTGYHELDLPSGTVRSFGLERGARNAQLVIGATTSLLARNGGTVASLLLRPGEPAIDVDLPANRNDVFAVPSTDEFVTFAYDGALDEVYEVKVSPSGDVVVDAAQLAPVVPWLRSRAPNGREVVTDGGGVFETLDGESARRLSDGVLVSASSHHLLVRECDESYDCSFVLIDGATDERQVVVVDSSLNPQLAGGSIQVSPDGASLRYIRFSPDGAEEVIGDLSTATSVAAPAEPLGQGSPDVWTSGSEGVVRRGTTGGLSFLDRSSGEVVDFAAELGLVEQFGTRLGIALPEPTPPSALTTGIRLIGIGSNAVIEIDLDTGTVVETEAPPLASSAPARVFPDAEGALFVSYDNVPSIRFDAAARQAEFAQSSRAGGLVIDGSQAGTLWATPSNRERGSALELVDALGRPLGPSIEFEDRVDGLTSDGTGRVLLDSAIGGSYVVGPDSPPALLTSGQLIALNGQVAYARECDAQLSCAVFRVDRATGERTALSDSPIEWAGAMPSSVVWSGSSVSPDGGVVLAVTTGRAPAEVRTFIVDTTIGRSITVPGPEMSSPIIWSSDSQFAVYLADGKIQIYDRVAEQVRTPPDVPLLKAIADVPDDEALAAAPVAEVRPDRSTGLEPVGSASELQRADTTNPNERRVVGPARFPF